MTQLRFTSVLILVFNIIIQSQNAGAQSFYIASGQSKLWNYNLDTQTATMIGPLTDTLNHSYYFSDIACDYSGQLFGTSYDPSQGGTSLYKIDKDSGLVTYVGPTTSAIGMTFTPDGNLWGLGTVGTSEALFKINPQTGSINVVSNLNAAVSGDLGFNPVTQKMYYSANVSSYNKIREISLETGAISDHGNFGSWGVFGFDFIGSTGTALGVNSGGELILMNPVDDNFVPTALVNPVIEGGCTGAAKYHCKTNSKILVNGLRNNYYNMQCGNDLILDGSQSENVVQYTWTITGPDATGASHTVTLQSLGTPGALDLNNDPQFSIFQLNQNMLNQARDITVTLKTWCDNYETPSTTTVTIHWSLVTLSWEISPTSMASENDADTATYFYEYSDNTIFKDTGTSDWQSARWYLDESTIGAGKTASHQWSLPEVGQHTVTYEVIHTNGCISKETRDLKIMNDSLYIPNAFTPDGDGLNDFFMPVLDTESKISDLDLTIYNRFGNQVFHGNGKTPAWDGTYKGATVEGGVYVYLLKTKTITGFEKILNGHVTLLR